MRWRALAEFSDPGAPKLDRLRRAAAAGFDVPETHWMDASELATLDAGLSRPRVGPCIVRSAATVEDAVEGTAAGRFESVVVASGGEAEFAAATARVVGSMEGVPGTSYVFVQPLLDPERGGVAFFDGFAFERTEAPGGNLELTSGRARGDVARGDLERGDAWSGWLVRLARTFRDELARAQALDVEYARSGDRFTLLQVRPAQFPVRQNPRLSLANHREILGAHPSPWIVSALVRAGATATDEFVRVDPTVAEFRGGYAEEVAGRAWISFSFFFRLMDHWGLPRAFVTEGVGGSHGGPLDGRLLFRRALAKSPRLVRLQLANRATIRRIPESLARLDRAIDDAESLRDWFDATVVGLDVALRTNFAINGALAGVQRVRRGLRIRGRARVVTETMREEYERVRCAPSAEREVRLASWLERFGHRGPLESDPMQPRFSDLADVLARDVASELPPSLPPSLPSGPAPSLPSGPASGPSKGTSNARVEDSSALDGGLWFRLDRTREAFRDELMRRWVRLRRGALAAAAEAVERGEFADVGDVWMLGADAFDGDVDLRLHVRQARERRAVEARYDPPTTARRDEIERGLREASTARAGADAGTHLEGIGLGGGVAAGAVRRFDELVPCLEWLATDEGARDAADTVLVVPAVEPSWGIVFGRVAGVVTDLGGELSHASILMREAGTVAVVNCERASNSLRDGERVRVDAAAGRVERAAAARG